jgi:hypothetical protein
LASAWASALRWASGRLGILSFGLNDSGGFGGVLDEERRLEKLLDEQYLDIICLNSGLEARVQSMQRFAPCASVKADGPGVMLLVFNRIADGLELEARRPVR